MNIKGLDNSNFSFNHESKTDNSSVNKNFSFQDLLETISIDNIESLDDRFLRVIVNNSLSPISIETGYEGAYSSVVLRHYLDSLDWIEKNIEEVACISEIKQAIKCLLEQEKYDLNKIDDLVQETKDKLLALNINESFYLQCGGASVSYPHSAILRLKKTAANEFDIYIYNAQPSSLKLGGIETTGSYYGTPLEKKCQAVPFLKYSNIKSDDLFMLNGLVIKNILLIDSQVASTLPEACLGLNLVFNYLMPFSDHIVFEKLSSLEKGVVNVISTQRSGNCTIKSLTALMLHLSQDKSINRKLVIYNRLYTLMKIYKAFSDTTIKKHDEKLYVNVINLSCKSLMKIINRHQKVITDEHFLIFSAALLELNKKITSIKFTENRKLDSDKFDKINKRERLTENSQRKAKIENLNLEPPKSLEIHLSKFNLRSIQGINWQNAKTKFCEFKTFLSTDKTPGFYKYLFIEQFIENIRYLKSSPIEGLSFKNSISMLEDTHDIIDLAFTFNSCQYLSEGFVNSLLELTAIAYTVSLYIDGLSDKSPLKNFALCNFVNKLSVASSEVFSSKKELEHRHELIQFFQAVNSGKNKLPSLFEIYKHVDNKMLANCAEFLYLLQKLPKNIKIYKPINWISFLIKKEIDLKTFDYVIYNELDPIIAKENLHHFLILSDVAKKILNYIGLNSKEVSHNFFNGIKSNNFDYFCTEGIENAHLCSLGTLPSQNLFFLTKKNNIRLSTILNCLVADPDILFNKAVLQCLTYILKNVPLLDRAGASPFFEAIENDMSILEKTLALKILLPTKDNITEVNDISVQFYLLVISLQLQIVDHYLRSFPQNKSIQTDEICDLVIETTNLIETSYKCKAEIDYGINIFKAHAFLLKTFQKSDYYLLAQSYYNLSLAAMHVPQESSKKAASSSNNVLFDPFFHYNIWKNYIDQTSVFESATEEEIELFATVLLQLIVKSENVQSVKLDGNCIIAREGVSKWVVNLLDFNVYCDGERWFSSSRTIQVPVKFQRLLGNQALDVNLINNTTAIYSHPLHGRCKLILNSKRVIGVIKVVNGSLYQYTNDNLRDIFKPSIVSNLAHWFLISGKGSLGLIYDLTTGQKVYEISQAGALTHYNVQNCNVSGYVEKSLSINPQILEVFLKLDDISWVSFYIKDEQIIDFTRFKYPGKNHSLKVIWSEVEHKWLLQDNLNLAIDFDANYSQFSNYLPLKSVDGFLSFLLVPVADISSMGFTQKSNFDLKVPDDLFDRNSLNFDTIVFKVEDSNLVAGEKISDQIYLFYLLLSQKKYHFALKIIQELNCSRGDLESVEEYFNKWLEKNFASFKDFSPNAVATVLGAILILQQKTGQILFLSHSFSTLKDVYSSCKNSVDYSLKLDQFEITTINKKFYYATKMKWEISQFQISSCVASEILAELKLYKSKNPGSDEVDFLADYTKNFSNLYWEFIIKIRQSYNTTELYKVVYEIVYDETLVLKDIEKELLLHLVFWSQDDNHNIFQFRQLKLKRDKRDSRQLKAFCESFFKGLHESNLKRSSFQEILVSFHANQKQEVLQENLNIKNEEQQSKIVHSIYDNHLIDNFACNDLVQVEQKDQNFGFVDSIATCVPAPNYSNVSEYFHKKYLQDELFASKKQISIYTTKHSFIQIRDWLKNEIAEISKTEAKLKKNILGKINFRPTQYLISEHQLNLKSGNLKKTTINDICRILIKRNWFRLLKNLNPCLGYFEIKDIRQKAINYMLAFTEREYLSFIELDLGQGECLDESVLKRLNNCRQFDITENNLFPLYFEYVSGLRLRKIQVELVKECYNAILKKKFGFLFQLNMAGGKTSVIISSLLEILAHEGILPCLLAHHSQIASLSSSISSFQRKRFGKDVILLDEVSTDLSAVEGLKKINRLIDYAIISKSTLLMKSTFPQLLLGLFQKNLLIYFENKSEASFKICQLLGNIISTFKDKSISLIDECDSSLCLNTEVHLPIGVANFIPVDEAALLSDIYEILISSDIEKHIGILTNSQKENIDKYQNTVLPLIVDVWVQKFAQEINVPGISQDSLKKFLMGESSQNDHLSPKELVQPDLLNALQELISSDDKVLKRKVELLALAKHLFSTILPVALGKSYNRHYGPLTDDIKGEIVPYQGVGVPSHTKFGDPYLSMTLALQASLFGNIEKGELIFLAQQLLDSAKQFNSFDKQNNIESSEYRLFYDLTGHELSSNSDGSFNERNIEDILLYINDKHFPLRKLRVRKETAIYNIDYFSKEISITPNSLRWLFIQSIACSGTIYNYTSFHYAYGEPTFDVGAEGSIIAKLKASNIVRLPNQSIVSIKESILNHPNKNDIKAIIDSGGFLKMESSDDIAYYLLKNLTHVEGIIYLPRKSSNFCLITKSDNAKIFLKDTSRSEITKYIELDKLFVYFDELRSTGTDIPLSDNAICLQTVDDQMPLRNLLQGSLRARKFFESQKIELLIEIGQAKKFNNSATNPQDIISTLIVKEAISSADQTLRSLCEQSTMCDKNSYLEKCLYAFSDYKNGLNQAEFERLKGESSLLYHTKNFADYQAWLSSNSSKIDVQDWLKNLKSNDDGFNKFITENHEQLSNNLPDYILNLQRVDSEVEQVDVVEQEVLNENLIEVNNQTEIFTELELQNEYDQYQTASESMYCEKDWTHKQLNWDKLIGLVTSVHDFLNEEIVTMTKTGANQKVFTGCFPSNLYLTDNLKFTMCLSGFSKRSDQTGSTEPVFSSRFKSVEYALALPAKGELKLILLSKHDANQLKIIIKQNNIKNIYLINLHKQLEAGIDSQDWKNISQGHALRDLVWFANFFNGNIVYINKHPDLSRLLMQGDGKIWAKYMLLKNFKQPHRFRQVIGSYLFNNNLQKNKLYKNKMCSYRSLDLANIYSSTRSLSPIDVAIIEPHLVQNLSQYQVQFLQTKAQIRALSKKQIKFLTATQINKISKSQVKHLLLEQLVHLSSHKLIDMVEKDKLGQLSCEQLKKITDKSKLMCISEEQSNLMDENLTNQVIGEVNKVIDITSLPNHFWKHLSIERLNTVTPAQLMPKLDFLTANQLIKLIKDGLIVDLHILQIPEKTCLSDDDLHKLVKNYLQTLTDLSSLKDWHFKLLKPEQVKFFSEDQLFSHRSLLTDKHLPYLKNIDLLEDQVLRNVSDNLFDDLSENMQNQLVDRFNSDSFDLNQLKKWQISKLKQEEIVLLNYNNHYKYIDALPIKQLSSAFISDLLNNDKLAEYVHLITDAQFDDLSDDQKTKIFTLFKDAADKNRDLSSKWQIDPLIQAVGNEIDDEQLKNIVDLLSPAQTSILADRLKDLNLIGKLKSSQIGLNVDRQFIRKKDVDKADVQSDQILTFIDSLNKQQLQKIDSAMLPANMSDRNISRLSSKQLKEIYGSKGFISWITHRFKSLFITGFNYTLMPFELLFNVLLGIILLPGTPFSAKVRKMCYKRALTTYYDALKRLVSVTSIFSFATYKKYTAKYKWSLYKISRIDL